MTRLRWHLGNNAELQLRLRPLREHWEARGPGMLRFLQKAMPWLELPVELTIILVPPKHGGGRVVAADTIEFEGVLANPQPQLPEVVRLAWLIACTADLDAAPTRGLPLIPAVLSAAEFVELARCDDATIQLAFDHWLDSSTQELSATALHEWWQAAGRRDCASRASCHAAVRRLQVQD